MLRAVPYHLVLEYYAHRYLGVQKEQSNFQLWKMMFKSKVETNSALTEKKKKTSKKKAPKKIPEKVKKDLEKRLKEALRNDKSHTKKLK